MTNEKYNQKATEELFNLNWENATKEQVTQLIQQGADVNFSQKHRTYEVPVFRKAMELAHLDVLEVLIDNGVNIENHYRGYADQDYLTAAIGNKDFQLCRLLIEKGKNLDGGEWGYVGDSCYRGTNKITEFLLKNKAPIGDGEMAARWGNPDTIDLLCKYGFNISEHARNMLCTAMNSQKEGNIKHLLDLTMDKGFNPKKRGNYEYSFLDLVNDQLNDAKKEIKNKPIENDFYTHAVQKANFLQFVVRYCTDIYYKNKPVRARNQKVENYPARHKLAEKLKELRQDYGYEAKSVSEKNKMIKALRDKVDCK